MICFVLSLVISLFYCLLSSGEKLGVCFVVILTFFFIFSTIVNTLPPNSTNFPIFYMVTCFVLKYSLKSFSFCHQHLCALLILAVVGAFKSALNVRYADAAQTISDRGKRKQRMKVLRRSNNICLIIYLIISIAATTKFIFDLVTESQKYAAIPTEFGQVFQIQDYGYFFSISDTITCSPLGIPSVLFNLTSNTITEVFNASQPKN